MKFYQVQKHHQRIIINDCINDENYVCSLTMKASIVLAIIKYSEGLNKMGIIDVSRPQIAQLVTNLEKCIQNHSYYKMIIRDYKKLLTQEDFNKGLVELIAVCNFLLEEPFQDTNKIWFVQTSFLEWREQK